MAFVRVVTALAASAALSSPMLLSRALGLTAAASRATTAVSASLGSTTTPAASTLEAYKGADLLSSPWIRTDGPVVQSMLYSAPWTRSGPDGSGEPLGSSSSSPAKTGSRTAGMMIASCTTGRYPVELGLASGGVPLSVVCLSTEEGEEQEGGETTTVAVVGGLLGEAPWTKNVEERTELMSGVSQVRCDAIACGGGV